MGFWTPTKYLDGRAAFILGGGPSLPAVSDLEPVHSKWVIGVNQAYELGHWVDFLWFGDRKFWNWNHQLIRKNFRGIVCTCNTQKGFQEEEGVNVLKRYHKPGITQHEGAVCWNYNSGLSAINLAYHLGANAVVLLGFDMRKVDGKKNYHDFYIKMKEPDVPDDNFQRCAKAARTIQRHAKGLGLTIVNTTPESALCFPFMPLEEAVKVFK